jgi:hypothetical protein
MEGVDGGQRRKERRLATDDSTEGRDDSREAVATDDSNASERQAATRDKLQQPARLYRETTSRQA